MNVEIIDDEEFFDPRQDTSDGDGDLSDFEAIPSYTLFKRRNVSSSISSSQSKIKYYGNNYEGAVEGDKLSGFGKLSRACEKEYIQGTWKNSQLVKIDSCQFLLNIHSVKQRKAIKIYGDNLLTFDGHDFIAEISIGDLNNLNFSRPLNPLSTGKGFLDKVTITKIFQDNLLSKRDAALEQFLERARFACVEDLFQFYKIIRNNWTGVLNQPGILSVNEKILTEIIKNKHASEQLQNKTKQLLDSYQLLLERNAIFPKFVRNIQPNLSSLLDKLKAIFEEAISNHKISLLKKCPHFSLSPSGLMTQDINKLYDSHKEKLLFLSEKDIQLFSDLATVTDHMQSKYLEQLWSSLCRKIEKKKKQDSLKDVIPLTHSIYFSLFKSLQELINEISRETGIPKENLLKINHAGNLNSSESIKWDKPSHTTCLVERQYHFVFKLMEHFRPDCYSHRNRFKYKFHLLYDVNSLSVNKLSNIPEERLVWLYVIDDAIESICNNQTKDKSEQTKKDFRGIMTYFVMSYKKFITSVKDNRYELFRVAAHNMIKFASQATPIYCEIESKSEIDKNILRKQLERIDAALTSGRNEHSFDHYTSLIETYNEYWEHRQYIEIIPRKFPYYSFIKRMGKISENLREIIFASFDKKVTTQVLITYLRSFNAFLKYFKCVDFTWFIKTDDEELVTRNIIEMVNSKYQSYAVLKPSEFISYIKNKWGELQYFSKITSTYKHYVISIFEELLNVLKSSLQRWEGEACLKITSELLLVMGNSLIHLKEQPNYSDYEQFLIDSTKPFQNAIENSNTYEEFKKRVNNIENFFLYAKKQNEIGIEEALRRYKVEVEQLRDSGFNTECNTDILKSCYEKYLTQFESYITDKVKVHCIINNIKSIISRVDKQLKNNKWSPAFKQNTIPLLLAGVAAIWSNIESKDIECTKMVLKPHCIQILCILKLLSVDTPDENIDSQFAQVLSGQGKSVILALLASLLALMESNVQIVCYSKYLASRDEKSFKIFFETLKDFKIDKKITYITFDDMANDIVCVNLGCCNKVNIRTVVERLVRGCLKRESGKSDEDKEKNILIGDEIDVFLTDELYGNTYNPAVAIGMPTFVEIQTEIWKTVSNGGHVKDNILKQMKEFVNTLKLNNSDTEFSKFLSTHTRYCFFEWHLEKMVDCALSVAKEDNKKWYINGYKINDDGFISKRRSDNIYSTNTVHDYYNVFNYFRLKKVDYDHKNYENYGYILVNCGSISYAELPREYPVILGVSGTLTQLDEYEKEAMRSYGIYKIASMPSFFGQSQLDRKQPFAIVNSEEDWLKNIYGCINLKIESGRAVLVFFDTENTLNKFESKYKHKFNHLNILTGNEVGSQIDWCINEAGAKGTVTLATRNEGRGVDFKSNDSSVEIAGGIHVIQTFFSLLQNEEMQIKFRTGRKTNKGSYELILCMEHLKEIECATKSNGDPVSSYQDLTDVRKTKAKERGNNMEKKRIEVKEKNEKTMEFIKSFQTFTPDQCNSYFLKFPLVEQVSKK